VIHGFHDPRFEAIYARRQSRELGLPIEEAWQRTTWRRIFSHHNADLAVVAALYSAFVVLAIGVVVSLVGKGANLPTGLQIIFSTAVFGTVIEILRRTYDVAVKRLATMDLFTGEILSIMRVFAAGNIIGDFVRLYDKIEASKSAPVRTAPDGTPLPAEPLASGFADQSRKENYFSIFEKNSAELASLDPAVVNDITAFYTFLKSARDGTGALQLWEKPNYEIAAKEEDVIAIVYLCFVMLLHGKVALDRLIASPVNRAIVEDIFAGVQLQCFAFLEQVLALDDFRRPRIEQRRKGCVELRARYGYGFGPEK
jgi:hypothetical protein